MPRSPKTSYSQIKSECGDNRTRPQDCPQQGQSHFHSSTITRKVHKRHTFSERARRLNSRFGDLLNDDSQRPLFSGRDPGLQVLARDQFQNFRSPQRLHMNEDVLRADAA